MLRTVRIASYEMGLRFRDGEFKGLLAPGRHWFVDPLYRVRNKIVSQRDPWLMDPQLDVIVKSGELKDRAVVLDLKDHERSLVWIDGRIESVLAPGLYAYWTGFRDVRVEMVDARAVRFVHRELYAITRAHLADRMLDILTVEPGHVALLYLDGSYVETLPPGRHDLLAGHVTHRLPQVDRHERDASQVLPEGMPARRS